jgi:hypothetical protein
VLQPPGTPLATSRDYIMRTSFIWIARPLLSQEQARRNARRAALVCSQRWREREDVQHYLARHAWGTA